MPDVNKYRLYYSRTRGVREVQLLSWEYGYDATDDRRLFRWGVRYVAPDQDLVLAIDLTRREADELMAKEFEALPVPTDDEFAESFTWGKVVAVHRLGDYQIVQYVPRQASNVSAEDYAAERAQRPTNFSGHVGGDPIGRSWHTLEQAIIGTICHRFDPASPNERSADYVFRMIQLPDEETP